jgi:hypothetical protein
MNTLEENKIRKIAVSTPFPKHNQSYSSSNYTKCLKFTNATRKRGEIAALLNCLSTTECINNDT